MKLSNDLPHDIALALARDIDEVALPMLEFSKILSDMDLLDIIYDANVQKLLAITRRKNISTNVAKSLVNRKFEVVTNSLLRNQDFIQNPKSFSDLIDATAESKELLTAIVKSSAIPAAITEKLLNEVAGQMFALMKTKYNILPSRFVKYISHSREISALSLIDQNSSDSEIDEYVTHIENFGRLTPSIILSALCMGKRRFFITSIARRAGLEKTHAISLIEKQGANGLHMLLLKAGIPEKLFDLIDLVITLVNYKTAAEPNISTNDFGNWLIEKLGSISDKQNFEYIPFMLALTKQSINNRSFA